VAGKLGRLDAHPLPPRIILNAVEGWGKTSCLAFAPAPAILMARGESGYRTLRDAGSVPDVDAMTVESWPELLATLDSLIADTGLPYKTLGLDAMGGFERMCHEIVCSRDFGGEWGEKGFGSYQKGYDVAVTDWLQLLYRLDKIHQRGVMIMMLSHSQIRPFKNPVGPDYDKFAADIHPKTWGVTSKWADAVLFGQFRTIVDKVDKKGVKGKGIGGSDRVIYCEHRDAFDAKNRFGMPEEIDIPSDPMQIWATIEAAIRHK
jgi:hypothetical protein